ncbi:MAG: response regulator [Kiritimatiellae bacterium]|nr:response regulator [Kiritimatiellia bacterium]MDD5520170.1 response regulator [Kiritimatiellia bacterium]
MNKQDNKRRVLIIEDDELVRKVVVKYVHDIGYEAVEAGTGLSALNILGTEHMDIVLLEIGIPDIDGFEILRRIKTSPILGNIPVLIMTYRDDRESIIKCMQLKAHDYIIKPVDPVMLEARFAEILDNTGSKKNIKSGVIASLSQIGSKEQFIIAIFLISVLPTLALFYNMFAVNSRFSLSELATRLMLGTVLLLVMAGYLLLAKYPLGVTRIRNYLALLAKGDLPQQIDLGKDADDLQAISKYISSIVEQTQERIRTIEAQTEKIVDTETRRVMIESLGTACHHIGQPATVINTYLTMMKKRESKPEMQAMITECQKASDDLATILEKLQSVAHYQAEPYRPASESETPRIDEQILKIDKGK